jgi:hypothetical protein
VTAAQFEDAEGRALVEAIHQRKNRNTMGQVIPDEAVEAAARAQYGNDVLSWDDGEAAPEWECEDDSLQEMYRAAARIALEAAAPHLMAEAWAEGHESGFWNGRESAGHHEMRYVGLEHAQLNNPYGAATVEETT